MRILLSALLSAAIVLGSSLPARALEGDTASSGPPPAQSEAESLHVELARVYVAEAGWHATRDHSAIYWAIYNRARERGISFRAQLLAYPSMRSAWARALSDDLSRPESWPAHLDWDPYRELWAAVLVTAATDLVFEPPNPCPGQVEHWAGTVPGTDIDTRRAARAVEAGRWRPLQCGDTRNAFFEVRRRSLSRETRRPIDSAPDVS